MLLARNDAFIWSKVTVKTYVTKYSYFKQMFLEIFKKKKKKKKSY